MEKLPRCLTAFAVVICVVGIVSHQSSAAEPLKCEVGPIYKMFGGSRWFLYSCADGRTLVVYSAPGSAAEPFYFMFVPVEAGYRLCGEGTGSKSATEAAMKELRALSSKEIAALIAETKAAKN